MPHGSRALDFLRSKNRTLEHSLRLGVSKLVIVDGHSSRQKQYKVGDGIILRTAGGKSNYNKAKHENVSKFATAHRSVPKLNPKQTDAFFAIVSAQEDGAKAIPVSSRLNPYY
jgi:hypothetical protein